MFILHFTKVKIQYKNIIYLFPIDFLSIFFKKCKIQIFSTSSTIISYILHFYLISFKQINSFYFFFCNFVKNFIENLSNKVTYLL